MQQKIYANFNSFLCRFVYHGASAEVVLLFVYDCHNWPAISDLMSDPLVYAIYIKRYSNIVHGSAALQGWQGQGVARVEGC